MENTQNKSLLSFHIFTADDTSPSIIYLVFFEESKPHRPVRFIRET